MSHGLSSKYSLDHSVCFTINAHLTKDKPNPETAPYWADIEFEKQYPAKNPIQLKTNASKKHRMNPRSLPTTSSPSSLLFLSQ